MPIATPSETVATPVENPIADMRRGDRPIKSIPRYLKLGRAYHEPIRPRIPAPFVALERAPTVSWTEDLKASGGVLDLAPVCAAPLRERGVETGRIGLVTDAEAMEEMPTSLYQELPSVLPEAEFSSAFRLSERAQAWNQHNLAT